MLTADYLRNYWEHSIKLQCVKCGAKWKPCIPTNQTHNWTPNLNSELTAQMTISGIQSKAIIQNDIQLSFDNQESPKFSDE